MIVRGENIVSLTAEAPPSQTHKRTDVESTNKPGKATAISRPSNVPTQPPSMKLPEQPGLIPPTGPLPKLQAPNIAINLKPPTMPPQWFKVFFATNNLANKIVFDILF